MISAVSRVFVKKLYTRVLSTEGIPMIDRKQSEEPIVGWHEKTCKALKGATCAISVFRMAV